MSRITINKKKIIVISVALLVASIILLFGLVFLFSLMAKRFVFNGQVLICWLAIIMVIGTLWWVTQKNNISKEAIKSNNDLEDTHFLSKQEIKQNKGLTVTKLSKLSEIVDGIPVNASVDKSKKDVDITLAKPIHTLVIGTTGSGKTTTFVSPTIELLSRTKTKPSLIITDPKGELYTLHANTLKSQGYNVQVLNFSEVYNSVRWNPFSGILEKQSKIEKEVEKRYNKYYVGGKTFNSFSNAEKELVKYRKVLTDEIFADMADLIYTMCPIENHNDSTWQKGARDLIFAVALALWEDVRDKKIAPEQMNLFNLYKILTDYANEDCADLISYLQKRDKFSKVWGLAKTVLVTQDKTLTSYLGDVSQYISFLSDRGIQSLTAGSDINFARFDEKPNVLFIKIPDAKDNRHKLVSLLLVQLYKSLVDKAGLNQRSEKTDSEELLRTTYFILDEFGNLPKLNKIDSIITVGRSRKIFLIPIIQDFKQLDNKYGKEVAEIVKANCNIKIFIQAGDTATNEEFSKLCGKKKVVRKSFTEIKDNENNTSVSVEERPLITPYELQNLNDASAGRMGNAIVLALGKNPIKAVFTPCFQAENIYKLEKSEIEDIEQSEFNENTLWFDIKDYKNEVKNVTIEKINENNYANENTLIEQVEDKKNDEFLLKEHEDRSREMIIKKMTLLKLTLKPYLKESDFNRMQNSDPLTVLAMLEWIIPELYETNLKATTNAIELKSFIENKIFNLVEDDIDVD